MGCNEECGQSCESVANLHEYAANLIEYSKRIDKWVNGGQTEFVDVGGVQTPTLRNLAMMIKALMGVHPDNKTIFINQDKEIYVKLGALIASGGGLNIDGNGKLFVDVASMNTQIFQNLMRTIRVPIWLTGHTDFYVNPGHPGSGDNIVDGRGTLNMPFRTIQACVNYVTNNYNMVGFNANIRIAAGTYNENLTLGEFSRTTGSIVLCPYVGADNQVNIKMEGALGCRCAGAPYYLERINLSMKPVWTSGAWAALGLLIIDGGSLYIRACKLSMTDLSGLGASADYELRMLAVYNNGMMMFQSSLSGEGRTSISFGRPSTRAVNVLFGERGGNIHASATNLGATYATIDCSGSCTNFLNLNSGNFNRIGGATYIVTFNGGSVTGQRYKLTNGSSCSVMGGGADYFPGNSAGTVEADTYCWYK